MGSGLRNKITDTMSLIPCPQCGAMQTSRNVWWNPNTGNKSYRKLFCLKCGYNKEKMDEYDDGLWGGRT